MGFSLCSGICKAQLLAKMHSLVYKLLQSIAVCVFVCMRQFLLQAGNGAVQFLAHLLSNTARKNRQDMHRFMSSEMLQINP